MCNTSIVSHKDDAPHVCFRFQPLHFLLWCFTRASDSPHPPIPPCLERRFLQPYLLPHRDWPTEGQVSIQTFIPADARVQIHRLLDYLKVAPHLVPKVEDLNVPTIRHSDLSPSNILISDSGKITGIIDWQHATILPLFLQAKISKYFQNYGDDDSENFRRPELAEDFANMTSSDKEVEMKRYRRRQVHYFYLGYTSSLNKAHFRVMGKYNLVLRNQLYDTAGRPWEGDNTSLQAQLIKTITEWSEIASPEDNCPVRYSSAEVEECLDRDAKRNGVNEQMQQVRDFIGINIDGLVLNGEFEGARARVKLMKDELAEGADTDEQRKDFEEIWPFQDHKEID